MSSWKESVPKPAKEVYWSIRKSVLNPESDWLFDKQYGDALTIEHGDIQATYDTSSLIAKRWFYPRYRDGSLHEPVVTRALLEHLDPDSCFFDIGANVGFYTVLASHCCEHVHSFEMDPRLTNIIHSHLVQNSDRVANVRIILAAVSNTTGEYISFTPHIDGNLSTNSITTSQNDSGTQYSIPTLSIDEYVGEIDIRPDVLKVDVEGFEVAVLKGLSSSLSTVETMFLEVHPSLLNRYGHDVNDVFDRLSQYEFEIRRFTDHRENVEPTASLEPVSNPDVLDANSMLLCTK
jgi:FkbM family methyltransferase